MFTHLALEIRQNASGQKWGGQEGGEENHGINNSLAL
jgi:hypothetical protein